MVHNAGDGKVHFVDAEVLAIGRNPHYLRYMAGSARALHARLIDNQRALDGRASRFQAGLVGSRHPIGSVAPHVGSDVVPDLGRVPRALAIPERVGEAGRRGSMRRTAGKWGCRQIGAQT